MEMVQAIRYHHPRMGTRKLLAKSRSQLAAREITLGRDALFEVVSEIVCNQKSTTV